MKCVNCGSDNRDGRRYCAGCGAPLSLPCPDCGYANESGDRFCGGCGAGLVGDGAAEPPSVGTPAPLVERRQATILFADLTHFTALTTRLGAEAMHRLVSRFFETLEEVVTAHGGVVERQIGDAVMAVFGYPTAHGNDAERAVRCALAVHAAMPELGTEVDCEITVHVGVAAGQIVVGAAVRSGKEIATVGDSVNLAARLVALAGPGETILSDAVLRDIADRVSAEEVGEVTLKGFVRPVRAWRVTSAVTEERREARRSFVGRATELRQFEALCCACLDSGKGSVVYLRGDAGIGKSRLVEEFAALAGRHGFLSHVGQALDFGVARGEDAVGRIVRSLAGCRGATDAAERTDAAVRAIEMGMADPSEAGFLYDLLDLPLPPDLRTLYDAMDDRARDRGKLDCLASLLSSAAATAPLLVIVEDVHWADKFTLLALAELAAATAAAPVILNLTTRKEKEPLDEGWRAHVGDLPWVTMELAPLRPEQAEALAAQVVAVDATVLARCLARAEGNPLFLEQLLRAATAGESEEVPGSVQSLVLARLDRLSGADRRAVQAASVLGQRFPVRLLRHLLADPGYVPDTLVLQKLLRPVGDDQQFAHALIWESVYASLLDEQRRALHARAAEAYGATDPALAAEHRDRAGDPRAAEAYRTAGMAERDRYHLDRALALFDRGLALDPEDRLRFELLVARGHLLRELGRVGESIAAFEQALALAADEAERCRALIGIAAGMRIADRQAEAPAVLDAAEEAARTAGLDLERSQVHYYRGNLHFPMGRFDDCRSEHERALEYARRAGSFEAEALALSGLGDAAYATGRILTAHRRFSACIDLARAHGLGSIEVANRSMLAITLIYLGRVEEALRGGREAVDTAIRVGNARAELIARHTIAFAAREFGDFELLAAEAEASLHLARRLGARRFEPESLVFLAWSRGAAGLSLAREALSICRGTGMRYMGPMALATIAACTDDREERAAILAEGEALLKEGCVSHNHFLFYRESIDSALRHGRTERAQRYVDALERYASAEPLPFSDFFVARGRLLIALARGEGSPALRAEAARLCGVAERMGLLAARSEILRATEGRDDPGAFSYPPPSSRPPAGSAR